MSRKRDDRRKKKAELARQLGVSAAEAGDHHHLQENERVTRPELRLQSIVGPAGLRSLLTGRPPALVIGLYVVESRGARRIGATVATDRLLQLPRISYTRPAHFIVVAITSKDEAHVLSALQAESALPVVDGEPLSSPVFATAAWEVARAAKLEGLDGVTSGAVVSVHGVGRSAVVAELPLERWTATLEIKL